MDVRVVTDSSSVVPRDIARDLGIETVPVWLHFGESSYRDGIDLDSQSFYRRLAAGEHGSTSSPSPGDFLRAYENVAGDGGEAVFVVTVARSLSAINDSARAAASEFAKLPVQVFDANTAVTAAGLVVIEAARMARSGADPLTIRAHASEVAGRVDLLATLDTFRYLRRSGRINIAEFVFGEALRVRPIIRLHDGAVGRAGLAKNRAAALERITRGALDGAGRLHAGVFHADALEVAEDLKGRLTAARPDAEVFISAFSPAMGAHTGPGVVGVGWWYS